MSRARKRGAGSQRARPAPTYRQQAQTTRPRGERSAASRSGRGVAVVFLLVALALVYVGARLLVDGVALSAGASSKVTAEPAECDTAGCLVTLDRGGPREVAYIGGLDRDELAEIQRGQRQRIELARSPVRGVLEPTDQVLDGGLWPLFSGLCLLALGLGVGFPAALVALERPETRAVWKKLTPAGVVFLAASILAAGSGLLARAPVPAGPDLIPPSCAPELRSDSAPILCDAAWTGLESDVSFVLLSFGEPSTAYVRVPPRDLLPRSTCEKLSVSEPARSALTRCLSASETVLLDSAGREHLVAVAALPSTLQARAAYEVLTDGAPLSSARGGAVARAGVEVTLPRPTPTLLQEAIEVLVADRADLAARSAAEPYLLPELGDRLAAPAGTQTQVGFEGHYLVIDTVISPARTPPLPPRERFDFEPLEVERLLQLVHP